MVWFTSFNFFFCVCGVCLTLFPTLLEFLDSSSLRSFRCVFLCLLLIVCHTLSGCTCVESFLHLWPLVLRLFSLCLLSRWGTSPHACHMLTCSCLSLFVFLAEELFSLIVFSSLLLSSWVLVLLLCCYFFVVYLFSAFGSKRMGSQTMTWEECGPWYKVTK